VKSLNNLLSSPISSPLIADDVLELHAARLLLLVLVCGAKTKGTGLPRLDGLTKMAKLDFLTRYPDFYRRLAVHLGEDSTTSLRHVESSMIRFHYGPWDERYYHVLGYLEAKGLLNIRRDGSTFQFGLTTAGKDIAEQLRDSKEFQELSSHVSAVKKLVGKMAGTKLKDLIYEVFGKEVVDRKLGEQIQ
jgi:hypothetical protein